MTSQKEQFYIQRITELEEQLKQRDERIAILEKQVAELSELVTKLTDKVAKLSKNSSNSSNPFECPGPLGLHGHVSRACLVDRSTSQFL